MNAHRLPIILSEERIPTMRLDFVNPASLMPSQPTETGAPAIPQPIQLGDIAPAFNLPEDGSKPEDKNPKSKNPQVATESDIPDEEVEVLPEMFLLALTNDFRSLLSFFLAGSSQEYFALKKVMQEHHGLQPGKVYSGVYRSGNAALETRDSSHRQTMFYHKSRPGNRFKGLM